MKLTKSILIGAATAALVPTMAFADGDGSSWDGQVDGDRYMASGSSSAERVLTDAEIRDIISRSGGSAGNTDVRYMGGSTEAADIEYCCGGTTEQFEAVTEVQETDEYIDYISRRDITQPIVTTRIQPITQEVLQGRDEDVYEDMVYSTNRLPVRIERDPTPEMTVKYHPQLTVNQETEETTTYYDVVTRRDIIQPVERTTVVPVQRRIMRPRVETITAEPRYTTITAPTRRNEVLVPETQINVMEETSFVDQQEYAEVVVPYIATRNVYRPKTVTTIQPVERQILNATSESITEDTVYETERLEKIVNIQDAPGVVENIIPQVTERTVLEVEDIYIDQVTRNIIQPVIVTTVQPVVNEVLRARVETETRPTITNTVTLDSQYRSVAVPQTVVNYIDTTEEVYQDEYSETYFTAVTHRDVYQPVVRTVIQPIENRLIRAQTETITNPTRYETVRASLVVLNLGAPCNC